MIDVSALPISCSVFLLNICWHSYLNYHYYMFLYISVHVLGLRIMEIISVGVLDLGAAYMLKDFNSDPYTV